MRPTSATALAAIAALVAPATASAHATVEPLDPARARAGSSVRFVLDAPNEELTTPGTRLVLSVPRGARAKVSAPRTPGWRLELRRRAVTKGDTAGPRRFATTRLTWTARPRQAVEPGATQRFEFRLTVPRRAGPLCFQIDQYFSPSGLDERPKVDRWRGPAGSARPASCVGIAPPPERS